MKESVAHTTGAALGGLLATAGFATGLKYANRLPQRLQPPRVNADPGEYIVRRVEDVLGRQLPAVVHDKGAALAHVGYGTAWPTVAAAFIPQVRPHTVGDVVVKGALLGAGVWAVSYVAALPLTGLAVAAHKQPPTNMASSLVQHALWGIAALTPAWLLGKIL